MKIMATKSNARSHAFYFVTSYAQAPSMGRFISGYTGLRLHLFIYIPLHSLTDLCSLVSLLSLHLLYCLSFAFNLHQIIEPAESANVHDHILLRAKYPLKACPILGDPKYGHEMCYS